MNFIQRVRESLADGRLATNLIAFYGLIVGTVIVSLVLRRWLARRGQPTADRPGSWLDAVRREISRRARTLLLWLTLGLVAAMAAVGVAYHVRGGDIRTEAVAGSRP